MKLRIAVVVVIFLFAFSCKKDANTNNSPVNGKWRFVGMEQSIGGPATFSPATADNNTDYIQFSGSGKVQSNFFSNVTTYKVKDSNILTINYNNTSTPVIDYYYMVKQDTLSLANTGCIEGCAVFFVKE